MNHLRSNKNIRKTSRTHGGDRKARSITNHDRRRTRGVWGSDRREDTSIGSGVERGTRVGDPLGVGRRRQSHSAEGLRRSGLVPPPRLLEPSREAQLGSRSPAMPGERNEHTRTRWNTRTRERASIHCGTSQLVRSLIVAYLHNADAYNSAWRPSSPCHDADRARLRCSAARAACGNQDRGAD